MLIVMQSIFSKEKFLGFLGKEVVSVSWGALESINHSLISLYPKVGNAK